MTVTWAQVAASVPAAGILRDSDRRQAFHEFIQQRRREAALETALACASPPIQASDDWRQVRKQVSSLASFQDLQEAERRTIIRAFLAGLQDVSTSLSAGATSQLPSGPAQFTEAAASLQQAADEPLFISEQVDSAAGKGPDSQDIAAALLTQAIDAGHQSDAPSLNLTEQMADATLPAETAAASEADTAEVAAADAQMALLEAMRREQREMRAAYEASMRDMTARLMEMEGQLRETNMLSQQQHPGTDREHETSNGAALNGKAA